MSVDTQNPGSRRALLAGMLGAAVASVAAALGRPGSARGADGAAVVVGGEYTASSVTKFDTQATGQIALWGNSDAQAGVYGTSTSSIGVFGSSTSSMGVYGASALGSGVRGYSDEATAVDGESGTGVGVNAISGAVDRPGMAGQSTGGSTGVLGYSGLGSPPAAKPKTGVYGQANQGTAGVGVRGHSSGGTGGHFTTTTGTALRVTGRVKLDNCAGIAVVASGDSSKVVSPGIDITSASAIVASVMSNTITTLVVRRVAIDTVANTFTVHLSGNAPVGGLKVAWHVFG